MSLRQASLQSHPAALLNNFTAELVLCTTTPAILCTGQIASTEESALGQQCGFSAQSIGLFGCLFAELRSHLEEVLAVHSNNVAADLCLLCPLHDMFAQALSVHHGLSALQCMDYSLAEPLNLHSCQYLSTAVDLTPQQLS